jgi:hypothetical protein
MRVQIYKSSKVLGQCRTFALCYVLLVAVIFCGCGNQSYKVEGTPTNTGGQLRNTNGIFVRTLDLQEFEYKGHTYISCDLKGGIAMTHAGHCWCNASKE